MTADPDHSPFSHFLRRCVPLAAWIVCILVVVLIPLKIIAYGYLPGDDALRHAAKAISGKPWSQILVLNPVYKIDHEFGWNWLLTHVHLWTNWDAENLVVFSVVALFVLVNLAGLLWLRRPEAWLAALLAAMVLALIPMRFLLGRPFLITVAGVITVLYLWRRRRGAPPNIAALLVMTAAAAGSAFFHGAWYLWALPVAAFIFAGEFRWGIALGICWAAGVLIGGSLTGHPIAFPVQALRLAFLAVGAHATERTMASELQPFGGDTLSVIAFGSLLVLRSITKLKTVPLARDPAFWLAAMCWVLAFKVSRFWLDWGWPALMVLIASDLELLFETRFAPGSLKRLGLVCALSAAAWLAVTSDYGSRWTGTLSQRYLQASDPNLKGWMPGKNGIFYTVDMSLFYQTFFKNPHGDWRYMLGFEPTWMPTNDFEIYQKILWNFNDGKAYAPWVKQMKPPDRLVVRGAGNAPPNIPGLEWKYAVSGIWIGRLPGANSVSSPPQ